MKKEYKIVLGIVVCLLLVLGIYYCFFNKKDEESKEIKYYTYEGNGKFVMSSTANKTDDYKKLDNNYYIKETINKIKSKSKVVEVLYAGSVNEKFNLYGYYTEEEFNKYFSNQIKDGMVCDNETKYYLDEGANMKCLIHEAGYKYDKIDSELCANINNKEVCIKANDWNNIDNYKKEFENVGWLCEYKNYDNGKWETEKPNYGVLECSKTKPSKRNHEVNELFSFIGTDGYATFSNNDNAWCSISLDLNTYCSGI